MTCTYLSEGAGRPSEEHKALRGFCGVDLGGGKLDDSSGIIVFRDQDKCQTLVPREESWGNCVCVCVCVREGRVTFMK